MSVDDARELQKGANQLVDRRKLGFIKPKNTWDKAVPQFEKAAQIFEVSRWGDIFKLDPATRPPNSEHAFLSNFRNIKSTLLLKYAGKGLLRAIQPSVTLSQLRQPLSGRDRLPMPLPIGVVSKNYPPRLLIYT